MKTGIFQHQEIMVKYMRSKRILACASLMDTYYFKTIYLLRMIDYSRNIKELLIRRQRSNKGMIRYENIL